MLKKISSVQNPFVKQLVQLKEKSKLRKEMKQTPIEALRIAVMGRLTELGIIHWHINVRGRSEYTIENKELADSLINM